MNLKIPGLHADLPHGQQGYFDADNEPIQERDPRKILFLPVSYFHASFLPRSTKDFEVPLRTKKRKYELGIPLAKITKYPEVFHLPRPAIVPDPWLRMNKASWARAMVETPLKKIKRRIFR